MEIRFEIEQLRAAVSAGKLEWRKHVLQRMAEREISQEAVRQVLLSGELIQTYDDDKPFPSGLLLGYRNSCPLHVVTALDANGARAFVITVYEPSSEFFEDDHRTRKRNE